jgi:hypothetical protein
MADAAKPKMKEEAITAHSKPVGESVKSPAAAQRKIPGNLPYMTAAGTLKRALERLIDASRPDKFNADFLENVLKLSGGGARATIPILKRMNFLSSDGVPTELYAKFRTASGRGPAAVQALKNGFPEIFKRSEYAHTVDDSKLRDIILEITGLKSNDPVSMAIKSTFNSVKHFIPAGMEVVQNDSENGAVNDVVPSGLALTAPESSDSQERGRLGLVYNINVVLPETSDLKVLNAIFKSLRDNLLR